MGTYTLANLREQVRHWTGLNANDTKATDAILDTLINSAIRTMSVEQNWDWHKAEETIAVTAGDGEYARHATCRSSERLIDVTNGINRPLKLVSPTNLERYRGYTGTPAWWAVERNMLLIAPIPTTSMTLRHVYLAADVIMTDSSWTLSTPDWAVDLVVIRAATAVATRLDNTSLQRLLKDKERTIMASLENDAARSRPPLVIERRRDWGV